MRDILNPHPLPSPAFAKASAGKKGEGNNLIFCVLEHSVHVKTNCDLLRHSNPSNPHLNPLPSPSYAKASAGKQGEEDSNSSSPEVAAGTMIRLCRKQRTPSASLGLGMLRMTNTKTCWNLPLFSLFLLSMKDS